MKHYRFFFNVEDFNPSDLFRPCVINPIFRDLRAKRRVLIISKVTVAEVR